MSFQAPITIKKAIESIRNQTYLLPAIQREFVWDTDQISRLFDSIMRDYPINSFLLWQIGDGNKHRFQFYHFLQHYRQYYGTHNPEANAEGLTGIQAVLDGQQRLTALYIGLTGTYAYKRRRVWWADNEYVLPPRRLFLNVSRESHEPDMEYAFRWLIEKDANLADGTPFHIDKNGELWFLTGRILDWSSQDGLDEFMDGYDFGENARFSKRILRRLWRAVHQKKLINYYLEESQEIDKVVDIFIRTNAGGTRLSFSDLLLSMATAGFKDIDARHEIYKLVDEINKLGFSFSKDFVLKSLLVLFSPNIRFMIDNFNSENIEKFEANWWAVRKAITLTVQTIKKLGFTEYTLPSHNALIPIVCYLFKMGNPANFDTAVGFERDRKNIAKYLHIAFLTRLYGRQPDSVLSALRDVIKGNNSGTFPLPGIMEKCSEIGRGISYSEELARGLLKTQMEDRYTFSILSLLYPNLDYNGINYHKDHLHPFSKFNEGMLDKSGITEPQKREFFLNPENYNSILNLQLLSENKNKQKQDKSLKQWVDLYEIDKDAHLIPEKVSLEFEDFGDFIEKREKLLLTQLEDIWH